MLFRDIASSDFQVGVDSIIKVMEVNVPETRKHRILTLNTVKDFIFVGSNFRGLVQKDISWGT